MKTEARTLIALSGLLMIMGALMVFSASGTYSVFKFDSIYTLFKSHVGKMIIAVVAMIFTAMTPYEYYEKYSKKIMLFIIGILILTLIFGLTKKGASRWIDIGIIRFQPSELAKIFLIVHLAEMIKRKGELIQNYKKGFLFFLIWIFGIASLVLLQPNVSTAFIIVLTSFLILYVGGAKFLHVSGTAVSLGSIGAMAAMILPHSRARILGFVNSIMHGSEPNMQVNQAKIALGSGGFWGVGIGQSRQSDLFLPESYGDFIFSILGEELGLIGAFAMIIVYLFVFYASIRIARCTSDKFGQMLAFGLSINLILSALINMSVVLGVIPTTGITLPFVSFGGTSIIAFSISVGILINIGYQNYRKSEIVPIIF
ncbi:MAG: putative lipid II flippase FtsW [Melioribacteraceae bacterium]|nr:putative lipid II flippase FtsW [Melioribacteraceae bacterium]MCF8264221.1 putative lipid II flippase FtsW [Melioribacteraceae bacterium]MCF8412191.1 putative lipid II flippase FtsW [Melioribacteraceae bacterium]